MKNQIKDFLNEEEIFRVNTLVNSYGMDEEWILAKLTEDHEHNSKELDCCDGSAGLMYDCYVNTHYTYLGSLGKLPYQIWQRFFAEFEEWLHKKFEPVCYRELLKEVVLPNDEYREYFKTYLRKDLLKVLLKKIDLRNQDIKEVYHV